MGVPQCEGVEHKKSNGWGTGSEGKGIVERKRKTILLFLAGARFLTVYLFFFINNRVVGLIVYITLGLGTHMTIYFEHLIGF
jgi:hypothetical protein